MKSPIPSRPHYLILVWPGLWQICSAASDCACRTFKPRTCSDSGRGQVIVLQRSVAFPTARESYRSGPRQCGAESVLHGRMDWIARDESKLDAGWTTRWRAWNVCVVRPTRSQTDRTISVCRGGSDVCFGIYLARQPERLSLHGAAWRDVAS